MNTDESKILFLEINEFLVENGCENKNPKDYQIGKYNYISEYMFFNCPHMCKSFRFFKAYGDKFGFIEDIKIDMSKSYEHNYSNIMNFIKSINEKYKLWKE